MKKLGILACAALASLCTAKLSAAVESDIVGYTTITMEAGKWYMIGNPFVALDGADVASVNDVFKGDFASGDVLQLVDPITCKVTTLRWNTALKAWAMTTRPNDTPAQDLITIGQAAYIKKAVKGSATFSGKVEVLDLSVGNAETSSWTMASYVYPVEIDINEIEWEGLSSGDTVTLLKDDSTTELYRWNTTLKAWSMTTRPNDMPISRKIKAGEAMYIYKKNAGVAKMINPIK